ncbi:NAD(P)/FAD-dependent oxidoreductase [Acetobacter sp.]|uniref:NAD(P)/FAD-dependent oxidoreductase n=1 Tax=Acetobacter sp. TaxID=440 RepID=UPI0039EC49EC
MASSGVVIVGAGHAGGSAAAFLRLAGYTNPITLVGEGKELPYLRPPLSKGFLTGSTQAEHLLLKTEEFYSSNSITLRLGSACVAVDPAAKFITLADGTQLAYDKLVLACGSTPSRIPVLNARNTHVLASLHDAVRLKNRLKARNRLFVVGGGYVGLEAAATARIAGLHVTVVEQQERILARVASPVIAAHISEMHRQHGNDIRTGVSVTQAERSDVDTITIVELSDGTRLEVDDILVGIGATPALTFARHAGLVCNAGIDVDENCRTSDPDIFAIGDMTRRPLSDGRQMRLESVQNALEQARRVAAELTGHPLPTPETPWFWSDQFGAKLQIAGVKKPGLRTVRRFFPDKERLSVLHLLEGRLICAETVNAAQDFMAARHIIGQCLSIDEKKAVDPDIPLKSCII